MVEDFRSNHFPLGYENNKLESEMKGKFRE